jgi:lipopolysaccharide transport system ATP-binding protein
MSKVIKVTNLSKIYRLGQIGTGTINRDLERWYKMRIRGQEDPFLKIGETNERDKKGVSDVVYSLRDINFEVQRGEALGIIGKNGAGKSTLLKIISRVTSPTSGKIQIKGRVASLLEVGTGFHPELSGRENIYLNGAILGMRKNEITRKLDEIIDFSGVERYIDTPVKRYSSGMYVRLAFAVAAHLESEIMIIDEVLAVGDAEFQKKCFGKMGEVSKGEGRTILFVSHNMGAIKTLCNRCIVLDNGIISNSGSVGECIDLYLFDLEERLKNNNLENLSRNGSAEMKIIGFHIENSRGLIINKIISGDDIKFVFKYEKQDESLLNNISLGFSIHNNDGDTFSILYSDYTNDLFEIKHKTGFIKCLIKTFPFSQGRYLIGVRVIRNGTEVDYPKELISYIDVENGNFYNSTNVTHSGLGSILIKGTWENV